MRKNRLLIEWWRFWQEGPIFASLPLKSHFPVPKEHNWNPIGTLLFTYFGFLWFWVHYIGICLHNLWMSTRTSFWNFISRFFGPKCSFLLMGVQGPNRCIFCDFSGGEWWFFHDRIKQYIWVSCDFHSLLFKWLRLWQFDPKHINVFLMNGILL